MAAGQGLSYHPLAGKTDPGRRRRNIETGAAGIVVPISNCDCFPVSGVTTSAYGRSESVPAGDFDIRRALARIRQPAAVSSRIDSLTEIWRSAQQAVAEIRFLSRGPRVCHAGLNIHNRRLWGNRRPRRILSTCRLVWHEQSRASTPSARTAPPIPVFARLRGTGRNGHGIPNRRPLEVNTRWTTCFG